MTIEACTVYVKAHEVSSAIDALGLTVELVRDAVEEGIQLRLRCTENDPDYLLGIIASGKITTAFRNRVVRRPLNWTREKVDRQDRTVSPDGKVSVIVAGGDEDTGIESGKPLTRSAKGQATKNAVAANVQSLADYNPEAFSALKLPVSPAKEQVWVLLHYIDEEAGEVRAEFSLPEFMDEDDHVSKWRTRIVFPAIPIEREPIHNETTDESDEVDENYKPSVSRRAG